MSSMQYSANDLVTLIKIAIDKPPYKTEDAALKVKLSFVRECVLNWPFWQQKYVDLANKYISKLRLDKDIDGVIDGLTTDENSVFLEYILKNLKSIAAGCLIVNTNSWQTFFS